MKRILYLGYHFKNLDWEKFRKFTRYVSSAKKRSAAGLYLDAILCVLKYKISLLEYYQFHFYELDDTEREKFAGTGYMYEYQLLMNPRQYRPALEDKRIFLDRFSKYIRHDSLILGDEAAASKKLDTLLQNKSGRLVLKSHDGQCGWGVEVISTSGVTPAEVISRLKESGNDIAEEYVVQHHDIMKLSPSGLNTVRIFTQLNNKDEVELLGCRLRISVNSIVDNMAAGNLAAPIDDETGMVTGPGVYSDITKPAEAVHPVTGVPITGFQVPYWKETIAMIKSAALSIKECRSVGWDIAITDNGPELIEGNHDWCKLVWQLPVQKGMKQVLEHHKTELINTNK